MSARFWMIGAGVALCSALAGFGLGGFAGGRYSGGILQDRSAHDSPAEENSSESTLFDSMTAAPEPVPEKPPEAIVCKGCGPTLAERQMGQDAYAAGNSDPALQAYEAGTEDPADPASSTLSRPPAVRRTDDRGDSRESDNPPVRE